MRPPCALLLAAPLLAALAALGARGAEVKAMREPAERPRGGDIRVTARAEGAPSSATLVFRTNFGEEQRLEMVSSGGGEYSATIPAEAAPPGAMVRWAVEAAGARDPPAADRRADAIYYGTVVEAKDAGSSLPVFELFCEDPRTLYGKGLPDPACALYFDGTLYDNVVVRRRGQSSLGWPKPKLRVASERGRIFAVGRDYDLKEFNFNSEWAEPGENSFMRETLAWRALREMGVPSALSYQAVLRLNGEYWGKVAVGEDWHARALQAAGLSASQGAVADGGGALLWKSQSGENANLRWDLPQDQVQYAWQLDEGGPAGEAERALLDLSRGVAGGDPELSRGEYLFDNVDLPRTVNNLAAQAVLLNQDRCTKNYHVFRDAASRQWTMLSWDVESAFSIDRGLGGKPAPDYCTLACEQWNSPLYCDREHPQDRGVTSPWQLISTQIGQATGGRRLAGAGAAPARGGPLAAALAAPRAGRALAQAAASAGAGADEDLTRRGASTRGAPGTFNYLVDAVLAVPATRAMYLRRLRTLMDEFIASGRLEAMVKEEGAAVRDEAKKDAAKWGNPGDPDRGLEQLLTEQLPARKRQLYGEYGPGGATPLVPEAQAGGASASVGEVERGADGYVRVDNAAEAALDVSGWKLSGGGASFTFVAGTVIPPGSSVYVAASSIGAFKARGSSPRGGEGRFVVGPLEGTPDGGGVSISCA